MASRYRSLSRPTASFLKSTLNKPTSFKPKSSPSLFSAPISPSSTFSRSFPQLGALQSLLPLHSAVSSARLTSCLGVDSSGSRSLSQDIKIGIVSSISSSDRNGCIFRRDFPLDLSSAMQVPWPMEVNKIGSQRASISVSKIEDDEFACSLSSMGSDVALKF